MAITLHSLPPSRSSPASSLALPGQRPALTLTTSRVFHGKELDAVGVETCFHWLSLKKAPFAFGLLPPACTNSGRSEVGGPILNGQALLAISPTASEREDIITRCYATILTKNTFTNSVDSVKIVFRAHAYWLNQPYMQICASEGVDSQNLSQ